MTVLDGFHLQFEINMESLTALWLKNQLFTFFQKDIELSHEMRHSKCEVRGSFELFMPLTFSTMVISHEVVSDVEAGSWNSVKGTNEKAVVWEGIQQIVYGVVMWMEDDSSSLLQ